MNNSNIHTQWESCQYDVFDFLRFPLVILVIYIHSTIGIPDGAIYFDNTINIANLGILLRIYISIIISSTCVPTFFLISGYLFYNKQTSFNLLIFKEKLKRRFHSLVIPYILWIILFFIISTILMIPEANSFYEWKNSVAKYIIEHGYLRIFYDSNIIGAEPYKLLIGWEQDHSAPLLFTFWYLRDLIVTILISPFLYAVTRWFRVYFILLLGVAYIFNIWPCVHGFSIVSIFYFTLGIYLSSNPNIMNFILRRYNWPIIIFGSALSLVSLYLYSVNSHYYNYIIHIFTIIGVFLALYIGWFFINKGARPINQLKNSAFFIYAAHMIYINRYCTLLMLKIMPWDNPLCGLLCYLLIPLIIAFVCLCIFCLAHTFFPHVLSLLNGGRTSQVPYK